MIDRLNHVAIAVPDLEAAVRQYRDAFCDGVSDPVDVPEHGVRVAFVELSNTKIELLTPLGESSPIAEFLRRNPAGGIHHICLETADIEQASERAARHGRVLGDGSVKTGAHGKPVVFLHPKDFHGTLIELEEA